MSLFKNLYTLSIANFARLSFSLPADILNKHLYTPHPWPFHPLQLAVGDQEADLVLLESPLFLCCDYLWLYCYILVLRTSNSSRFSGHGDKTLLLEICLLQI